MSVSIRHAHVGTACSIEFFEWNALPATYLPNRVTNIQTLSHRGYIVEQFLNQLPFEEIAAIFF